MAIQYLHKTVFVQDAADGQLLESFISHREEAVLEALVQRWGGPCQS
jgi:hypothetical protein